MGNQVLSFNKEDITLVYDALQGFSPGELALALLEPHTALGPHGASSAPESHLPFVAVQAASRCIASMLQVLCMLGPNLEASSRVVIPWKTAHLAQLSCVSWPEALGMRIVIPSAAPRCVRATLLAKVLAQMAYV